MHGLTLACLLASAFLVGAYLALFVRALIGRANTERVQAAAESALTPEALAHLRAYLGEIDEHEQARIG